MNASDGPATPRSARLWLVAAFALCGFPIVERAAHPLGEQLFLPATPLDRTDGVRAAQWAFLESCRSHMPENAIFTVLANDADTEMSLFMMSVGAFPYSLPTPMSYYRMPTPEGLQADFVLTFQRLPPDGWNLRLVANVKDGAIYARVPGP